MELKFSNLKDWFSGFYQVVLGQEQGPRLGSFVKFFGIKQTIELLKEIDKMRNTLVTDEEMQNAKAKYTGNFVLSLENASTVASFARNIITQDLTEDYYNTFLSNIDKVSKEDVQKASQKYFQTSTTRIFITGKGSEILESLENIDYNGEKLTVRYFDNFNRMSFQ